MAEGTTGNRRGLVGRLLDGWRLVKKGWQGYRAFGAIPRRDRHLVFYAETAADWAYLGPVSDALTSKGQRVLKIVSDPDDPVLQHADSFFVGYGSARTALFKSIDADSLIMTLSDLQTFHLKRSLYPVHYFYIFHSIASTHRAYREHAFDAYDTILCVGPHHEAEIRRTEESYGLKAKRLVPHGYGRLDVLIRDLECTHQNPLALDRPTNVLVAPSWGESSIVAHCLDPVLESLLGGGFQVTIRLHPMTRRHDPGLPDRLLARYAPSGRFQFDPHINTTESLLAADVMVSEWSGAPLEYAFARERPVIFVDTPPKINNPAYERVKAPMLEVDIREQIGKIVRLDAIGTLPTAVSEMIDSVESWSERIRLVRESTVYNVGRSGQAGADAILECLRDCPQSSEACRRD